MHSTLSPLLRNGSRAFHFHSLASTFTRRLSTESLQVSIHKKLTSRRPNKIFDYLTSTPSHLLNISLADFLPGSCYPPGFTADKLGLPSTPSLLPDGHHLVYFSPQVRGSDLLPDGTDPLQSPGEPFVRRMWAGGALRFDNGSSNQLELNNRRAYCSEHIPDILVKGQEGDEKVIVNIERRIGYCRDLCHEERLLESTPRSTTEYGSQMDTQVEDPPAIIETRNIIFMREKSAAATKADVARPGKILKRMSNLDSSLRLS